MARPLRLEFAGAVYHVTARGNARQDIYLDDADRERFLALLGREIGQQRWRCYAYCLMGNHYHLLFETPEPNLVIGMRRLNATYAQSFNRRHGRVGHVLQGRYHAILVDRERYLLELCRYVVLNPVRAGLVRRAEDWRWSSYRATAGRAPAPAWLRAGAVLRLFGGAEAAGAYRRFVAEGAGSPWRELRGGIWLGPEEFRERMQRRLSGATANDVPTAQRQPSRPTAAEVIEAVAQVYGTTADEVLGRRDAAFRAAVYLLRRAANLPLKAVGQTFAISPPWVSRIQSEVERGAGDRRLRALRRRFNLSASPPHRPRARPEYKVKI